MTHHQFGTLKHLRNHEVSLKECGELSMVTFSSLIKRGWVIRNGGYLVLTQEGEDAFQAYNHSIANYRKVDTGLTEHVKHLLHIDTILSITKKKAS